MEFRSTHFTSQPLKQLATTQVRIASAASVALLITWATLFDMGSNRVIRRVMDFPESDKVGHLVLYGALTATVVWALGDRRISRLGSLPAWPTLIFGLGLIEEFRQRGLDDRSFELADVAANTLGICAGWMLMLWISNR